LLENGERWAKQFEPLLVVREYDYQ
jgi:hypothetical protein